MIFLGRKRQQNRSGHANANEFAEHPHAFLGLSWEDSKYWNDQAKWSARYLEACEKDLALLSGDGELHVDSNAWILLRALLPILAKLSDDRGPEVLDAGCGLNPFPYLLANLGCNVRALDFSGPAIDHVKAAHSDRKNWTLDSHTRELCAGYMASVPGTVTPMYGDWFDGELDALTFDIIYCSASLTQSTKPYWRKSLERFRALLSPTGHLIVLSPNAIVIREEVESVATSVGFARVTGLPNRDKPSTFWSVFGRGGSTYGNHQTFIGCWPTG